MTAERLACASSKEWLAWLKANHASSTGIWLVIGKKGHAATVTYAEAVEAALSWGWIDGQKQSHDAAAYLQRFSPRSARSIWSKINREKALKLIADGQMKPAGLSEVERARKDGRWDQAYDSPRTAQVPEDLAEALSANKKAAAFFAQLDGANRYAILWRVQTAKKPETRQKRIELFVAMLAKGETIHPRK
ncbi:MAG TPA: YdeI/OmpD-associated family protein [Myxococcales bacterium]|jgi:uncharacterized protein YdeI (YjbR/CyaY-like superfamily)|nr:YdeI/OmpD-associated family protein [Myxococcales bacterium]